jgi:hypothetical protein
MAVTNKARRIWLLKQKFSARAESTRNFAGDYDAIHALLGVKTLSVPNCRWTTKALVMMRSRYSAVEHGELLDHLEKKLEAAFQRAKDRKAGREEARKQKPGRKPLITLPPLPELDPWLDVDVSQFTKEDDARDL